MSFWKWVTFSANSSGMSHAQHFICCFSIAPQPYYFLCVHAHRVKLLYPELFSCAKVINLDALSINGKNGKAISVYKKSGHCWSWSACNCCVSSIFLHLTGRKIRIVNFVWVASYLCLMFFSCSLFYLPMQENSVLLLVLSCLQIICLVTVFGHQLTNF